MTVLGAVLIGQNITHSENDLSFGVTMTPPTLSGLHHVTLPVADLDDATTWFEAVFGARRLAELDHHDEHGSRFAVVLSLPGVAPLIALRHTQDVPEEVVQWALGVVDRAELVRWAVHFGGHGVTHSEVLTAQAGHVMTCTTPGGATLLLYAGHAGDAAAGPTITDEQAATTVE